MEEHMEEGSEPRTRTPSGGDAEEAPTLSAAYLPYDDARLWVGMPGAESGKERRREPRRRPTGDDDANARRSPKTTLGIAALLLPLLAFTVFRLTTGSDAEPVATTSPSPVATVQLSPVTGLRAIETTKKRVVLEWQAPEGGPFRYTVYRDGAEVGSTTDPTFTDEDVEADRYYYYSVVAVDAAGAASPPSEQLLVAILTNGAPPKTATPPPPPPPVYVPPPPPTTSAPTKSPSPSPTKSKSPSPSPTSAVTRTWTFSPPPCDPTNPAGSCYDPCLADPASCVQPTTVFVPPLFLMAWTGADASRRRRDRPARRRMVLWPGG